MSNLRFHDDQASLQGLNDLAALGQWLVAATSTTGKDACRSILDEAGRRLLNIAALQQPLDAFTRIDTVLREVIAQHERSESHCATAKLLGLATGIPPLDAITGGLRPGGLSILAGAPSLERTRFLLRLMSCVAKEQGQTVGFFSLGTGAFFLGEVLLDSLRPVDLKGANGTRAEQTQTLLQTYEGVPLHIDFTPALGSLDIRARSRHLLNEHEGLGLIVVGALSLMAEADENPWALAKNMQALNLLADELNCHVMVVVDLAEPQTGQRLPVMADLQLVGPIDHVAEVILLFAEEQTAKSCRLFVAHNNYGPTMSIELGKHHDV